MVEVVGKESDVVLFADLPEGVLTRTEDPEKTLLSKERMGLLPCFPGS